MTSASGHLRDATTNTSMGSKIARYCRTCITTWSAVFIAFGLFLLGPASHASSSEERTPLKFSSVAGALFDPVRGAYRGTGVLVSRCHVLTNHHVAFRGAPLPGQRMEFHTAPDAHGRFRQAATGVVAAWNTGYWPERGFHQDWALIVLDQPSATRSHAELLPTEVSLQAVEHLREQNGVVSLGYVFPSLSLAGPAPKLREQVCSLRARGLGRFTNCTIVPGSSGGPIVRDVAGRLLVVGLNVALREDTGGVIPASEEDPRHWNPAVPLDPLSGNATAIRRAMAEHACPGTRTTAQLDTGA